jgi:Flp pilus assembly protein protease CpaA
MWVPYAACAAPLLAVAAIILGFAGMGGGKRGGTNGLAVAGLVTGFLHILVLTLLFAFFGYALMRYGKEIRKEVEKERRQQRGRYERE